jgi:hypothetical protein
MARLRTCRYAARLIDCTASVLPAEGLPELVAAYLAEDCLPEACGPFVDECFHVARMDLQRLVEMPYPDTGRFMDQDSPRPRKSISTDCSSLIDGMVGRKIYGGERILSGSSTDYNCLSMELVYSGRPWDRYDLLRLFKSTLESASTARWRRGRVYNGSVRSFRGRRGYIVGRVNDPSWTLFWWLVHRCADSGRKVDVSNTSPEIYLSASTERQIRELAPNLLS